MLWLHLVCLGALMPDAWQLLFLASPFSRWCYFCRFLPNHLSNFIIHNNICSTIIIITIVIIAESRSPIRTSKRIYLKWKIVNTPHQDIILVKDGKNERNIICKENPRTTDYSNLTYQIGSSFIFLWFERRTVPP